MNTYIFLVRLTDTGAAGVHQTPDRIDQLTLEWTTLAGEGSSVTGFYTTTGEFDHVIIARGGNDDAAAAFALLLASLGHMRTVTLRAFDKTEVAAILLMARPHL